MTIRLANFSRRANRTMTSSPTTIGGEARVADREADSLEPFAARDASRMPRGYAGHFRDV